MLATLQQIHLIATTFMTGVILVVHFNLYPLFRSLKEDSFQECMKRHQFSITWIVFPPMLAELICSLALVWVLHTPASLAAAALTCGVWLITGLQSAPAHERLLTCFDPAVFRNLMRWNGVRVLLWIAKLAILLSQGSIANPTSTS
ncbi:MAG: hypothetical protein EBX52_09750 [Proteobacteria bacterium]|nr:hypothetical protein [Pseudomonadota bacterium]